jgi:AAA ATPase-like protein
MLSSGQQELLPLLVALDNFRFRERYRIYIEEPEAHLFPSAQSDLVDLLVYMGMGGHGRYIVVTTHSPYVLTRLNVLKKAALVTKKKPRSIHKIQKILRGNMYVGLKGLAAYTIANKKVISVVGKDGLIDGDYLDSISGQLSREFNDLLEIEYAR